MYQVVSFPVTLKAPYFGFKVTVYFKCEYLESYAF